MNLVGCVIDSCDEQILANDRNGLLNHLCRHLQYFPFGCGYCIENGRKVYYTTESSLISHTNSIHGAKEIKIFEDINERKEQRLRELIGQMSANSQTTPEREKSDQSGKRVWPDEREDLEHLQMIDTDLCDQSPAKKQKAVSNILPSTQSDETISKPPTPGKRPQKARKSISPRKSPKKFPFLPGQKSLFDYYGTKSTTTSASTGTVSNQIQQTTNEPDPEDPEEILPEQNDTNDAEDVPPSMKGFLCKKCDRVTGFQRFYVHVTSHIETPFVCVPCGISWKSATSVRSHITAKHPSKEVKDFHKVGFREEMKRLWVECYGARDFNCALCDKKKAGNCSPKHIRMHLKKNTDGLSFEQMGYKCFGQYFKPGKDDDSQDPSVGTNEAISEIASPQPLPTPNSAEKFEGLNCMKCNQSVALSCVRKHLLRHTPEAPYKCVCCKQGFRSDVGIKEHIKKQHPGKPLANVRRPGVDEELVNLMPLCYGLEKLFCDVCKEEKGIV